MEDNSRVRDLSELVNRHAALLYRYAYRLCGSAAEAEDLTQQAYLTAHRKLHQLRDPARAKGWLCAILRTTYLKGLRRRGGVPVVSFESLSEIEDVPPDEPPVDPQELQRALDLLPEEFRTPVILYYFREFSYKEIARQMDVPVGTVMSRLARAKTQLRRHLAVAAVR